MRNGFGGAGASHIAKTIRLLKDRGAQAHLLVRLAHCVSRQYPDATVNGGAVRWRDLQSAYRHTIAHTRIPLEWSALNRPIDLTCPQ